jgi:circadian clock protein KaiC
MSNASGSSEVNRISTGITGLDALLQGGFLPGRSYLVTGDPGTGKTTACMQFLLAGLQQGEKSVCVTVDERPGEILQSAASLDWDLQKYVHDKSLVILDASPYFSGGAASMGEKGIDVSRFITDLADYANKLNVKRLTIDPITPLILSRDPSSPIQEGARTLIHLLQTHFTTTNLLTSHVLNRANHDSSQGTEEFLASGVIVLGIDATKERVVRSLRVKKMRATAVEPCEVLFNISKKQGISLLSPEQKPVVVHGESLPLEFFELPKE